ncbi:MAG: hypothetical protein KY462_10520 [Actinobacteria bacterium]|nr:hypothetical protein [Actinomycetota bacterium]
MLSTVIAVIVVTRTQTGTTADAGPAPVELEGSVNDHGTADLTGDSLDLEADDFYFAPTFVRTSTAGIVQVRVFNEGDQRHTFTIEEQDVDVALEPGSEQQVDVLLPDSGRCASCAASTSTRACRGVLPCRRGWRDDPDQRR